MTSRLLWLLIAAGLIFNNASAQSPAPGFSLQVQMIADGLPVNSFDTTYNIRGVLQLQDTSNISKIHVKIGTSLGADDILNHQFLFDVLGGMAPSMSYHRSSHTITLGLGKYPAGVYYVEALLEDVSGTLSDPVRWSANH